METKRCDFSEGDAHSLATVAYRSLVIVVLVAGMALNSFIASASASEGLRKPLEQILAALSTSRFLYLCLLLFKVFCMMFIPWVFEITRLYQAFKAAVWFLTCSSIFFSASLCAFYCAKIARFQRPAFIFLKRRIHQLIPWMLSCSVFVSLVNTSPFFYGIYRITCSEEGNSSDPLGNTTGLRSFSLETNQFNLFVFCSVGFLVAFSCLASLASLLLFSLRRHTTTSTAAFSSPNLDAHFQAVKIILSNLIIESVNFVALLLLLSNVFWDKSPENRVCNFTVMICPTLQSSILLWGNPKLKGALLTAAVSCGHWRLSWS